MKYYCALFVLMLLALPACQNNPDFIKPNVVIIFLDDSGWEDFAPFGELRIETPNVSRLASEGCAFHNFYVPQAICSASRSALMSGCYPGRSKVFGAHGPDAWGLDTAFATMGEVFSEAGYATAAFGKWHCGDQPETRSYSRGFDETSGLMYSNDMWKYHPENPEHWGKHPLKYWENGNVIIEEVEKADQKNLTRWYTDHAVDFIKRHSNEPFLLYVPHSMPHVPLFCSDEFAGKSGKGLYGDVILEIDWSVGEVLKKLEEQGLLSNTLVIFSSDNGPWLAMREHGGTAGILREGKQFTFEGGQRVPTLALWPDVIEAGSVYEDMALMMDWFPTFAEITGAEMPSDRDYDGESILKVLDGTGVREGKEFLYYDGADLQCYRNGDWKLKLPYKGFRGTNGKKAVAPHDTLLFNLKSDPGEKINLYAEQPEKVSEMVTGMDAYRQSKGELPPSLDIGLGADHAHNTYLVKKYGPDYNHVDW